MNRRILLASLVGLPALFLGVREPRAQNYPTNPIRIIVAYPPGGGNDVAARVIGARLQERLGQPVIVDNRPGAAGQVGTAVAANAAPDGYTLLLTNPGPQAVSPALQPSLPYDVVKSFAPIAIVAKMPFFVVVPGSSPYKTLAELIAERPAKTQFSALECTGWGTAAASSDDRFQVVVAGMESHVCVLQTVLDLLSAGYQTFVVVDAIAGRRDLDHQVALERMANSGATLTSAEAVLFEWCESASAPEFKQLSALVKGRGTMP